MTKAELRKKYILLRSALTDQEYEDINHRLCESFFSTLDLSGVRLLHTFLPIKKKKEPDTDRIMERLRQNFPEIRIAIPQIDPLTDTLNAAYFEKGDALHNNKWGIPEPVHADPAPVDKIDLVIVPLLAFDSSGHRIGYGKGYYDKFLAQCNKEAIKVGLSAYPPEPAIEGLTSDDVALDHCVTPGRLYTF
jgi:5-formyltetrahydrofolate cyclo-ligase